MMAVRCGLQRRELPRTRRNAEDVLLSVKLREGGH
jgi:hypothetical protein